MSLVEKARLVAANNKRTHEAIDKRLSEILDRQNDNAPKLEAALSPHETFLQEHEQISKELSDVISELNKGSNNA